MTGCEVALYKNYNNSMNFAGLRSGAEYRWTVEPECQVQCLGQTPPPVTKRSWCPIPGVASAAGIENLKSLRNTSMANIAVMRHENITCLMTPVIIRDVPEFVLNLLGYPERLYGQRKQRNSRDTILVFLPVVSWRPLQKPAQTHSAYHPAHPCSRLSHRFYGLNSILFLENYWPTSGAIIYVWLIFTAAGFFPHL